MQPNPNPNSTQFMQASHFLRLLSRLNRRRPSPPHPSDAAAVPDSRGIRRAAYASMAYAVRPQRPWSRALLRSLRSRDRPRARRTRRRRRTWRSRASELRRLVPGGTGMELGSLLEETAHYIECLRSQVKLMQRIADYCGTPCQNPDGDGDGGGEGKL